MKKAWSISKVRMFIDGLAMYLGANTSHIDAVRYSLAGVRCKEKDANDVIIPIKRGASLSHVLKEEMGLSSQFVGIIKAGELSGNLREALEHVSDIIRTREDLKRKIIGAMIYPGVIFIFSCAVLYGILTFVLPQILPLLKDLGDELPPLTNLVVWLSEFVSQYLYLCIIAVAFTLFMTRLLFRRSSRFRWSVCGIIENTPVIGRIYVCNSMFIFYSSLGKLLSSKMRIEDAINYAGQSIWLDTLRHSVLQKIPLIKSGTSLTVLVRESDPIFNKALLLAGERSGNLDRSFTKIGELYFEQVSNALRKLTALVEPIIMIFMGFLVGTIVIAIMLPLYDISKNLQQ
jgi:type II secretory pathway component PulF